MSLSTAFELRHVRSLLAAAAFAASCGGGRATTPPVRTATASAAPTRAPDAAQTSQVHAEPEPPPLAAPPVGYVAHRLGDWAIYVPDDARDDGSSAQGFLVRMPHHLVIMAADLDLHEAPANAPLDGVFDAYLSAFRNSGLRVGPIGEHELFGRRVLVASMRGIDPPTERHGIARVLIFGRERHGLVLFCESGEASFSTVRSTCTAMLDSVRVPGSTSGASPSADERRVGPGEWSIGVPRRMVSAEPDEVTALALESPDRADGELHAWVQEFNGATGVAASTTGMIQSMSRDGLTALRRQPTRVAGIAAEDFEFTRRIDSPESDVVQIFYPDRARRRAIVVGCGGPSSQGERLQEVCGVAWRSALRR